MDRNAVIALGVLLLPAALVLLGRIIGRRRQKDPLDAESVEAMRSAEREGTAQDAKKAQARSLDVPGF